MWALHGYLGRENAGLFDDKMSDAQLVVGHEEYRRVLHHENHFRRAFGEVLRNRTILFLGCGLGDPDVLGLLDEAQALVGPGIHPHYAVLFQTEETWEEKARMLQIRLGVTPIVLPDYRDMIRFLCGLRGAVQAEQLRQVAWSFNFASPPAGRGHPGEPSPDLEIVRGGLPTAAASNSVVVVSAGIENEPHSADGRCRLFFSPAIQRTLHGYGVAPFGHRASRISRRRTGALRPRARPRDPCRIRPLPVGRRGGLMRRRA